MSSHHVVRENQEPALVIFDVHAIPFEKIQELLEWIPTIVVLHTQLETVLSWGIKVDVLLVPVGEEAMLTDRTKEQQPIRMVSYNTTETPFKKAIQTMEAQNMRAVNYLVSDASALALLVDFKGDVEVFFDNKRWGRVKSGRFEKWVAAATNLFVLPEELHPQLPNLKNGKLTTEQDGIIILQTSQPFWVGEELE